MGRGIDTNGQCLCEDVRSSTSDRAISIEACHSLWIQRTIFYDTCLECVAAADLRTREPVE